MKHSPDILADVPTTQDIIYSVRDLKGAAMKALVKKKVIEDQAKAEGIRVKLEEEMGNRSTERIGPGGRDRRGPINNHNQGLLPFEGKKLGGGDVRQMQMYGARCQNMGALTLRFQ